MADSNEVDAAFNSVSWATATLRALGECGLRTILLTGAAGKPEGFRPAPAGPAIDYEQNPGGFVVATAAALASRQRTSVLVVQADASRRPRQPGMPPRGGLWELVHDLYLGDVLEATARSLGLGDWLEILAAQGRSGELTVRDGSGTFRLRLVGGSIRDVETPAAPGDLLLAGKALRARTAEQLLRLIEARGGEIRFAGCPATGGAACGPPSCLDRLFHERLREHLPHPYLESRTAGCLAETRLPNLKLLASGGADEFTPALRRPLEFLLRRIGRGFDLVLIDAAPVSAGGPTGVLAGLADAVLLVTGPAALESARVVGAVQELRRTGAGLVGVVTDQAGLSPSTNGAADD